MKFLQLVLIVLLVIYVALLSLVLNPLWIIVMVSAGLAFGSLGSIIAIRKLYFLAGASPHIALLAVALSIPLSVVLGGSEYLYSIIGGILLVYIAGYMIYRGIESDIATAMVVASTASLSVIVIYYVLTRYPIYFSISAIITGDPLLVGIYDAMVAFVIALFTFILVLLTYREQLAIGIDRNMAELLGLRIWVYDLLLYTLIGLVVVGLLKIVGFILAHVLVLLPPSIAVIRSRSAWEALYLTIVTALVSSLLGLHFGVLLDISPTGLTGLILLFLYILAFMRRRT
ncbi:MAG: metal ABC transporter permease [Thermoprotei archaeon]